MVAMPTKLKKTKKARQGKKKVLAAAHEAVQKYLALKDDPSIKASDEKKKMTDSTPKKEPEAAEPVPNPRSSGDEKTLSDPSLQKWVGACSTSHLTQWKRFMRLTGNKTKKKWPLELAGDFDNDRRACFRLFLQCGGNVAKIVKVKYKKRATSKEA